LLLDTVEGQT